MANLRTTLDSAASTTAGASTAAGANPADQGSSADQAAGGADAEAAGRGDADPGQSAPAADDEGVDTGSNCSMFDGKPAVPHLIICFGIICSTLTMGPSCDSLICCTPAGSNERASQATPVQQIRRHSSLAAAVGGLSVSTLRTISSSNPQLAQPPAQWMLFNDFVIRETRPAEVQATYAGQKTPCMLYYTRVWRPACAAPMQCETPDLLAACSEENGSPGSQGCWRCCTTSATSCSAPVTMRVCPAPDAGGGRGGSSNSASGGAAPSADIRRLPAAVPGTPLAGGCIPQHSSSTKGVIDTRLVVGLLKPCACALSFWGTPALQGPHAPVERNFTPLQDDEALRPGTVFGIDAEFVALSQPDKVLQGCAPPAVTVHNFAGRPLSLLCCSGTWLC